MLLHLLSTESTQHKRVIKTLLQGTGELSWSILF